MSKTIRITENYHGVYVTVIEGGEIVTDSEKVDFPFEVDEADDLLEELTEAFPGAEIIDER